jgi:hypothetical protein
MVASDTFRPVGYLAIAVLAVVICQFHADAFQVLSPTTPTTSTSKSKNLFFVPDVSSVAIPEPKLQAKKKPVEPEREKNDALGLFLLFMTPWRNPNSIFVYMLLLLYALGKINEAQSSVGVAGL